LRTAAELLATDLQVRVVLATTVDGSWVFTASRDTTIKGWKKSGTGYEEAFTLVLLCTPCALHADKCGKYYLAQDRASCSLNHTMSMQAGHQGYVVALAVCPPGLSTEVPGLALVSGSRDTTAKIWDVELKEAVCTLSGHKYQVNAVGVLPGGVVATGELDGTLRTFKAGKTIRTLKEHEGAILCLLVLPNEDILTGARPQLLPFCFSRLHCLTACLQSGQDHPVL
jgi:WD40 repeat protein